MALYFFLSLSTHSLTRNYDLTLSFWLVYCSVLKDLSQTTRAPAQVACFINIASHPPLVNCFFAFFQKTSDKKSGRRKLCFMLLSSFIIIWHKNRRASRICSPPGLFGCPQVVAIVLIMSISAGFIRIM